MPLNAHKMYPSKDASSILSSVSGTSHMLFLSYLFNSIISYIHLIFTLSRLSTSAIRRFRSHALVTALAGVQHSLRLTPTCIQLGRGGYGFVATEAFAHVDHAALALAVAVLQLLTLGG